MSKIKRNDPCPCGSGKKYKKCCGKDNVIAFSTALYKSELDQLHKEFTQFAFEECEEELAEATQQFAIDHININDDDQLSAFNQLVLAWAVFTIPLKQNKTAFELFFAKTNEAIKHPAIQKTFAEWKDAQPGVFEIFPEEKQVKLFNHASGETFFTSPHTERNYSQGDIAIGVLIPYAETHEFFSYMIQLPPHYLEDILDLLDMSIPDDLELTDVFPEFLGSLLQRGSQTGYEWTSQNHQLVALAFTEHASKKNYNETLILKALEFWSTYCEITHPTIRKVSGYAAALDYFSRVELLVNANVTQADIAKEYGTSAGTVSTHYRKMADEFEKLTETI